MAGAGGEKIDYIAGVHVGDFLPVVSPGGTPILDLQTGEVSLTRPCKVYLRVGFELSPQKKTDTQEAIVIPGE